MLSDIAYSSSYQVQWTNFASWLIVGGLIFSGLALLWAFIELLRADRRGERPILYFLLLLAPWVLGFIHVLIHSKAAWSTLPAGLILTVIVAAFAISSEDCLVGKECVSRFKSRWS